MKKNNAFFTEEEIEQEEPEEGLQEEGEEEFSLEENQEEGVEAIDGLTEFTDSEESVVDEEQADEIEMSYVSKSHSDDQLKIYLKEIGETPLLSKEDEFDLFKRIHLLKSAILKLAEMTPYYQELKIKPEVMEEQKENDLFAEKTKSEYTESKNVALGIFLKTLKADVPNLLKCFDVLRLYEANGDEKINKLIAKCEEYLKRASEKYGQKGESLKEWFLRINVVQEKEAMLINHAIKANLRLVCSMAKNFQGRGLSLMDLIEEGNAGLMRGVEKFEYQRGWKFSTYATWWVRQALSRAIADQSRTIRVPVHAVEALNRLKNAEKELTIELCREPNPEEIAIKMSISLEKVKGLQKISKEPISLSTPVGEDGDTYLSDFIEDKVNPKPDEIFKQKQLEERIEDVLKTLEEREADVIRKRFGLGGNPSMTLEEIAALPEYGLTRERIRQIEVKAKRKLRHPSRLKFLQEL